jgi:hypothetical protein
MRIRIALISLALGLFLSPSVAELKVQHDDSVDFGKYRTYAWKKGTPAARPEVQQWVVDAVERELTAKGLHKAAEGGADLFVKTYAFGQTEVDAGFTYSYIPSWNVGVLSFDVNDINTGTLIVDLIDPATDAAVWRGMASKAVSRDVAKAQKKIDNLTKKMFNSYPPR